MFAARARQGTTDAAPRRRTASAAPISLPPRPSPPTIECGAYKAEPEPRRDSILSYPGGGTAIPQLAANSRLAYQQPRTQTPNILPVAVAPHRQAPPQRPAKSDHEKQKT